MFELLSKGIEARVESAELTIQYLIQLVIESLDRNFLLRFEFILYYTLGGIVEYIKVALVNMNSRTINIRV